MILQRISWHTLHAGSYVKLSVGTNHLSFSGLIREPKYSHLKELHRAVKLCEHALVSSDPTVTSLATYQQVWLLPYILFLLVENSKLLSLMTLQKSFTYHMVIYLAGLCI